MVDENDMLGGADEAAPDDNALADAPVQDGEDNRPQADAPPSVDDLASEMGWSPKDQWRGDPAKWKPAADYLRTTIDVNKGLSHTVKTLKDQVGRMERTSVSMAQRAADQARAEALAAHQQAVDEGDHAAAMEAARKVQRIDSETVAIPRPAEAEDFANRHSAWFQKDEEATKYAISLADDYAKRGLSAARQIAMVEKEMAKVFPEYFQEAAPAPRAKAPVLNSPGARSPAPRAKGFDQLPDEAKRAALESEKRGWGTKDEYAKIYFEEQA